jgi:hypothetical protein
VKRHGLGLAALAIAVVVVFAPRPWLPDSPSGSGDPSAPLVGRILSPTFNQGELQEQRYEHSTRDVGFVLWVVAATGLALILLNRRSYLQEEPLESSESYIVSTSEPSRAPPPLVLI